MGIVIGIDIGGSTTKIVGFKDEGGRRELISPQLVKANDPLTATYGAFGKFTDENGIKVQKKRDFLPIWKEVSLLCTIYKNDRKVKKKVKK